MSKVMVVEARATEKVETLRGERPAERPDPAWVRGKCPHCGDVVVSNLYYVGGQGYLLRWECWSSLGEEATCDWRKVL
jgi:hypothetical protein